MVLATSGYSYINYNRIVTSSAAPYSSQTGSLTYRDPLSNVNREIRALRISTLTISYALIYDISNKWSDLATIDFTTGASKITYKR
jgi:hypothetical protein